MKEKKSKAQAPTKTICQRLPLWGLFKKPEQRIPIELTRVKFGSTILDLLDAHK
jgi:hypothetical protein